MIECRITDANQRCHRGVDLISDALPFGRLWDAGPNAISNAIEYAKFYSRSPNAVIRACDAAGDVHPNTRARGRFQKTEARLLVSCSPFTSGHHLGATYLLLKRSSKIGQNPQRKQIHADQRLPSRHHSRPADGLDVNSRRVSNLNQRPKLMSRKPILNALIRLKNIDMRSSDHSCQTN